MGRLAGFRYRYPESSWRYARRYTSGNPETSGYFSRGLFEKITARFLRSLETQRTQRKEKDIKVQD
jgi:hypothetical protein